MRRPLVFAILVLAGLALDLCSKWLVFAWLNGSGGHQLIPGVLHIVTAENHGVAFSLFREWPGVILGIRIIATALLVWLYVTYWREAPASALAALNLALIGAAGNLTDQLVFGHVRDFIDFVPRIPLIGHWAVFNVADMCITTGVILYLFGELFSKRPDAPDVSSHE
jgi:signal peptidase II